MELFGSITLPVYSYVQKAECEPEGSAAAKKSLPSLLCLLASCFRAINGSDFSALSSAE
jgi:hypothetical protein